jgi:hypothetical protein
MQFFSIAIAPLAVSTGAGGAGTAESTLALGSGFKLGSAALSVVDLLQPQHTAVICNQ